MNTFVPEHFGSDGKPKRPFNSYKEGEKFLIQQNWKRNYEIYKCHFCGKWHLASLSLE